MNPIKMILVAGLVLLSVPSHAMTSLQDNALRSVQAQSGIDLFSESGLKEGVFSSRLSKISETLGINYELSVKGVVYPEGSASDSVADSESAMRIMLPKSIESITIRDMRIGENGASFGDVAFKGIRFQDSLVRIVPE